MLIPQLAYRNLVGAGLRTWLNVSVLAFAYVLIVWHQGLFNGMLEQGTHAMIDDEVAGGQYWHQTYDPFDPMSLEDAFSKVPGQLKEMINNGAAEPVLIMQASIYPEGRIQSVLLKGIDPDQKVVGMPTVKLTAERGILPVMIGKRMAKSNSLNIGDNIMIRWRDANGTFDAKEGTIVDIMSTNVVSIDRGQLWVSFDELNRMSGSSNNATMIIVSQDVKDVPEVKGWDFKDQDFLLSDIYAVVKSKRVGAFIMYVMLLFMAMLAIFDTQVLSIFRRRKEIGTLMALGMTRLNVILLFTFEGIFNGILAIGVAVVFGTPLLILSAKQGLTLPAVTDDYGLAISNKLFPSYSLGLVGLTVITIMVTVTIVSYMPSRKISKLNPTDALKGKTG